MAYVVTASFILGTKRQDKIKWNLLKNKTFCILIVETFLYALIWLLIVIIMEYSFSIIKMKKCIEPLEGASMNHVADMNRG